MTEQELGAAMLAHEKKISRSYLELGRNARPFPNRTPRALEIIRHLSTLPHGHRIRTSFLYNRFAYATVHQVLRKLLACKGITHIAETECPRWYQITDDNREMLEEILYE